MSRSWKIQAMAACAVIALMFAAVGARFVWLKLAYMPAAQAESEPASPCVIEWATITQTAATHEGPGLYYPMTGAISAGRAVEVVRQLDGWCKCLTYQNEQPVWVWGEYLEFAK